MVCFGGSCSTGRDYRAIPASPLTLAGPLEWSLEAHLGLLKTFGDEGALPTAEAVRMDLARLWLVNSRTWVVTERFVDFLWIHCLQGFDAIRCIELFGRIAHENGLKSIRFATAHRQAARITKMRSLRHLQPTSFALENAGEYEIRIETRYC